MPPEGRPNMLGSLKSAGRIALGICLVSGLSPIAIAGGSVALSEVLALAQKQPSLRAMNDEVMVSLRRLRVPPDEVSCSAIRMGRHWEQLGGMRVPPYECDIGQRKLRVTADVEILDNNDRPLDGRSLRVTRRAAKIRSSNFKWYWVEPGRE